MKARMGWTFPWVSAHDSAFNYDFAVSFSPEDRAAGRAIYNYGTPIRDSGEMFGLSVFVKDATGAIHHAYSTYHRGTELLMGAFNWLDLAPKGRNEGRHDELGPPPRRLLRPGHARGGGLRLRRDIAAAGAAAPRRPADGPDGTAGGTAGCARHRAGGTPWGAHDRPRCARRLRESSAIDRLCQRS